MWDPYAEFETATWPNGLAVHALSWPNRGWQYVEFVIHSGALQDPVGLEGTAHYVEHMISKNAPIPYDDLKQYFRGFGGGVNTGGTNYFATKYGFFIPKDRAVFTEALELFGSMLLDSPLDQFHEREREVIKSEFNRKFPFSFKFELLCREQRMVHVNSPIRRLMTPLGSLETIGRITLNDLQAFYSEHYTPRNMSIVSVGGFGLEEVLSMINGSAFAEDKGRGKRNLFPAPLERLDAPGERVYVFEVSKHLSAKLDHGEYRSVHRIPTDFSQELVQVVRNMLDQVLFDEVRSKRAWAYSISSSWGYLGYYYEYTIDSSGLSGVALKGIGEVVEECIASLYKREDLFEQVRSRMVAIYGMKDLGGEDVLRGAVSDIVDSGSVVSYAAEVEKYKSLTFEDVRSILSHFAPENRWTRLIVP